MIKYKYMVSYWRLYSIYADQNIVKKRIEITHSANSLTKSETISTASLLLSSTVFVE